MVNFRCEYIARRMLYDACNIMTPINRNEEPHYSLLLNWTTVFTRRFGHTIQLPNIRSGHDTAITNLTELYSGILENSADINSIQVLNCLFTITYYLMMQYEDYPVTCSRISCCFVVVTRNLESWNQFPELYETNL